MEKPESEPVNLNYRQVNPRLIEHLGELKLRLYLKQPDGVMTDYPSETQDLKVEVDDRLELYAESSELKDISEKVAQQFKDKLHIQISKETVDDTSLASLISDWVEVCISDVARSDKDQAHKGVSDLKVVVSELLNGYQKENFGNLLKELDKLDYSTAQHSIEIMFFMINYFESESVERKNRMSMVGSLAALLHDVGKQAVPDEIILKAGPLTDEEYDVVKKHPGFGKEIIDKVDLKSLGFSEEEIRVIIDAEYEHHEREDGSGYPKGLIGDEISDIGRIMAIIDIFTAVTSTTRPYRKPISSIEAVKMINDLVDQGKLNKAFTEKFVSSLERLGILKEK